MRMLGLVLVVLALVACKKNNPTCDKFVAMTLKCPDEELAGFSDSEKAQLEEMLMETCNAAMVNATGGVKDSQKKMVEEMNATVKRKATCVAAAASCEEAKRCDDKPAE